MIDDTRERINPLDQERTLKGVGVNTAALLCYLGVWVSGIIFLVLEQKNRFIRFHSLQSIITFGVLFVVGSILGRFPVIGGWLSGTISLVGFILWIILMVKAGQGELFKLPWVGDLSERLAYDSMPRAPHSSQPVDEAAPMPETAKAAEFPPQPPSSVQSEGAFRTPSEEPAAAVAQPAATLAPSPSVVIESPVEARRLNTERSSRSEQFKVRYYSFGARTGRIVGSAFAIAFGIAILVFFNFYRQYVAYYHANISGGKTVWEAFPLVTGAWDNWLPYVTVALSISILGHALMIAYDRYITRQITHIVIDVFSLVSIIALLSIFPFDFSPIPNSAVVQGLEIGLPTVFVLAAIGTVIAILVRFITLVVHVAQNRY